MVRLLPISEADINMLALQNFIPFPRSHLSLPLLPSSRNKLAVVEIVIRTLTVRVHNFYCNVSMTLWSPSSGKKTTKKEGEMNRS